MPTNGVIETNGHTTSYLEEGPKDGPLIVLFMGGRSCRTVGDTSYRQWLDWGFMLLHRICAVTADRQNTGNTPPTPKKMS
ncbi:MAG: hypothetical protein CM1200mP9_08310 [Gammaproteobacteria bacterium]|nr:MAG: hypothetical protein CM1200mP9_08310 [Gammaproteobacteria bacterium]